MEHDQFSRNFLEQKHDFVLKFKSDGVSVAAVSSQAAPFGALQWKQKDFDL